MTRENGTMNRNKSTIMTDFVDHFYNDYRVYKTMVHGLEKISLIATSNMINIIPSPVGLLPASVCICREMECTKVAKERLHNARL